MEFSPQIAKGHGGQQEAPYCAFIDDRYRFWALAAREVRKVLIALILALVGLPIAKPVLTSQPRQLDSATQAGPAPAAMQPRSTPGNQSSGVPHPDFDRRSAAN